MAKMNAEQQYKMLLQTLPQDLTDEELSRLRLDTPPEHSAQTALYIKAICRNGRWYGTLIMQHSLGVVGHIVITAEAFDKRDDACDLAQAYAEMIMDYHEQQTGVRHRGKFEDGADENEGACP